MNLFCFNVNCRDKMVQLMQRTAGIGQMIKPVVVYDLDSLLHNHPVDSKQSHKKTKPPSAGKVPKVFLGNDDELKVGKFDKKKKHSLKFESRFEGGNLRKAIQVTTSPAFHPEMSSTATTDNTFCNE